MVSTIVVGEDERSRSMMIKHYDPIARRFTEAFVRVVPGLSKQSAVWAYMFAHGGRMQVYARSGRAQRLAGRVHVGGPETVLEQVVAFTAAGIRALAEPEQVRAPARERRTRR